MKAGKKILFISHEASNSGAPKLLLALLKFLKLKHPQIHIDILFLEGGVLLPEFQKHSECFLFGTLVKKEVVSRLKIKLGLISSEIEDVIVEVLIKNNYNVVYGNTIVTASWLQLFKKYNLKTILHVHESKYLFNLFKINQPIQLHGIDRFIAVSQNVADNLVLQNNVAWPKLEIIYPFVVDDLIPTITRSQLKSSLGLDKEIIIGCVGYPSLIKGSDMLPLLCKGIVEENPNLKFKIIVIGGTGKNYHRVIAEMDSQKLGVGDKLMFVENTEMPQNYFNIFDIFLSLSREESFSLATLNAAEFGIPIISFRDCGGPTELVSEEAAFFVDYLSISGIIQNINYMLKNPDVIKLKTRLAKMEVSKKFNAFMSCRKITETILCDKCESLSS